MEKSFLEIITSIKPGEIWESVDKDLRVKKITLTEFGTIKIEGENAFFVNNSTVFDINAKYKLQRKEYTFEEAFKAYENGKEIENIERKVKFKKKITGLCFYKFEHSEKWLVIDDDANIFSIDAIRGKWYIND